MAWRQDSCRVLGCVADYRGVLWTEDRDWCQKSMYIYIYIRTSGAEDATPMMMPAITAAAKLPAPSTIYEFLDTSTDWYVTTYRMYYVSVNSSGPCSKT